ncbi:MAG TPA: biotin/lipoyl-binding protein [Anaerolineales bacterium]
MMRPNPKVILPAIAVVAVAIAGWWYFGPKQVSADVGQLSASGTIEATEVTVASELSGRVAEVLVAEGDPVKLGQALVRFDDSLLQAQLNNAKASLALAQANYNLVSAGATTEQRQSAISAAQLEVISAQQAVDALSDHANLATARAEQAVAAADKALDLATQKLDNLGSSAEQVDIDSAQATVVLLQDQLDKARKAFDPYQNKAEDNLARAMLQNKLAGAQKKYDAAVNRLNNLLGTANSYELNLAKADKTAAEAQLADARLQYDKVKDGPDPDSLALAELCVSPGCGPLVGRPAKKMADDRS